VEAGHETLWTHGAGDRSLAGIGRAIAVALAEEGAEVAINYVSNEPLARTLVTQIQGLGRRAILARADISDYPDTFRMAQES